MDLDTASNEKVAKFAWNLGSIMSALTTKEVYEFLSDRGIKEQDITEFKRLASVIANCFYVNGDQ